MERRLCKRLLVLLVSVALALTVLPMTFAADPVATVGSTGYNTLQEAIDAAASGDTVILNGDTSENVSISGKSLTVTADIGDRPTLTGSISIGSGEVVVENLNIVSAASGRSLVTVNSGSGSVLIQNCLFSVEHALSGSASVVNMTSAATREITVRGNSVACVNSCSSVFRPLSTS